MPQGRRVQVAIWAVLWFVSPARPVEAASAPQQKGGPDLSQTGHGNSTESLSDILTYISSGWDRLKRTDSDCGTFEDTKASGGKVLYIPTEMAIPSSLQEIETRCGVRVEHLPERITKPGGIDPKKIVTSGLLYLPNPYVVPGGQFNEMYGWDSYFILRGLLREKRLALAKGIVENFFFEIEHYGGVLNANRTYYLTRSQPPFLSSMVLAVYDAEKAAGQNDPEWLRRAYQYVVRDYDQWNQPPHLAGDTGLSRYFDHGDGPVPEIQGDPSHYYRGVAQYFLIHGGVHDKYLESVSSKSGSSGTAGPTFPVYICNPSDTAPNMADCAVSEIALTDEFYKGDRSMRESGFDVTFRFGPFGADTQHYAPVCLNSLLFKTEMDLSEMSDLLGLREDGVKWREKALQRRKRIDQFLWNEREGQYFDYEFTSGTQSSYEYVTTFYPLWAGVASPEQARSVEQHLSVFEQPGGLVTSTRETQAQWDYPYGWAPMQLIAVEGLRRYGFGADADRISRAFLRTVVRNFRLDHTIREKYDVVRESEKTHIDYGYTQNVTGFGWTNGVFLELLHGLLENPPIDAKRP